MVLILELLHTNLNDENIIIRRLDKKYRSDMLTTMCIVIYW